MMNFKAYIIQNDGDATLLNRCFDVRRRVFVEEQGVDISIEIDEYDKCAETLHLIAISPSGEPAGAGRLIACGIHGQYEGGGAVAAKIGRVSVLKEFRGRGAGTFIVEKLLEAARARGYKKVILHSQIYIVSLYEKFGFKKCGEVFQEAGIDHIEMIADI